MIASAYPAQSSSSTISSISQQLKPPLQTYRPVENDRTGIIELIPVGTGLYITSDSDSNSENNNSQSQSSLSDGDFGGTSLAFSKNGTRMVVGAGGSSYGTPGGNYAVEYELIAGSDYSRWAPTGIVLHGIIFHKEDPTPASSSSSSG
jgi:hypothetical protein